MSMDQIYTLLGYTLCRNDIEDIDFVGSISEGIEIMPYLTNYIVNSDIDYVYNLTELKIPYSTSNKEMVSIENEFSIETCHDFPGYVSLKLDKPIMGYPYLRNNVFELTFDHNKLSKCSEVRTEKEEQNGPTVTEYRNFHLKVDNVICFICKFWPVEASKWDIRNKPNNWPSKTLIEQIKSKGFNLAPVGHKDCVYKEYQWRIGIRGEKDLLLNLNETQMMCYIALRLILKCDMQLIDQDVLSSFHMKNVVFWCAEQESCQWTKENFEICLTICINRLMKCISSKQFPHYFIEDRNLINSTMTIDLKERIVKALTKYRNDIKEVLSLSIFDPLMSSTQNFRVELVELKKQESIIERCIMFYHHSLLPFVSDSNNLWETYKGHNTEINLQNAERILSRLENTKRHFICPYIAYAKNILGLLDYSRYNKSLCHNDKLKAWELLISSMTFEHVSLKFRVANFFFIENEFENCLGVCDVFLSNPNIKSTFEQKRQHLIMVFTDMTIAYECDDSKMYELKEKILSIFHREFTSEKCGDDRLQEAETVLSQFNNVRTEFIEQSKHKSFIEMCQDFELFYELKKNLEILYGGEIEAFLLIFNNFANLVFRDMSFNVPYLASEKWAVPEVIQYELLSVKKCHENSYIYGIYIDPMLNCLVLTFLCYQETKKWKQRDEVLTKMHSYVYGYSFLANSRQSVPAELSHSLPLYRVCNILAYCCVKAGRYRQALNYILYSYTLYRRRKNTAFSYIKCVRLYIKEYIMT